MVQDGGVSIHATVEQDPKEGAGRVADSCSKPASQKIRARAT